MTAELSVAQDMCMGSGYCVRLHPARFELDTDGICQVLGAGPARGGAGPGPVPVTEEEFDVVQEAANVCPGGAIEFDRG